MNIDNVVLKTVQELSSLRYFYKEVFNGAIDVACERLGVSLTDDERSTVQDKVKEVLSQCGYQKGVQSITTEQKN